MTGIYETLLTEWNERQLNHLSKLTGGGENSESLAFSKETIDLTRKVLDALSTPPKLTTTGNSTIKLEYEGDENYLKFEINGKKIEYYTAYKGWAQSGITSIDEVDNQVAIWNVSNNKVHY